MASITSALLRGSVEVLLCVAATVRSPSWTLTRCWQSGELLLPAATRNITTHTDRKHNRQETQLRGSLRAELVKSRNLLVSLSTRVNWEPKSNLLPVPAVQSQFMQTRTHLPISKFSALKYYNSQTNLWARQIQIKPQSPQTNFHETMAAGIVSPELVFSGSTYLQARITSTKLVKLP